ncbi:hypothetical protein [Maribellus maritimus]|uniref:hypothetical protein n=1 Tax=Maribellus maritimus TaxID=2870838 RepID=UPI001EECCE2D|nr:hypothetical protein [Maribellus maritimus]MCG6191588.1 hypothetical protein [Maribellus maritimus]
MSLEIKKQEKYSTLVIRPNNIVWGIAGFVSLIFLGFVYILVQTIIQMITGDINVVFILFIGLFFWAAYYNFFNFYYMILGNEIIEIHDNYIKQKRTVWKITHSKKYLKSRITKIELNDSSNKFGAVGLEMFGLSTINVTFKYGSKKKAIGKQINMKEAKLIIGELENKMYATQHAV